MTQSTSLISSAIAQTTIDLGNHHHYHLQPHEIFVFIILQTLVETLSTFSRRMFACLPHAADSIVLHPALFDLLKLHNLCYVTNAHSRLSSKFTNLIALYSVSLPKNEPVQRSWNQSQMTDDIDVGLTPLNISAFALHLESAFPLIQNPVRRSLLHVCKLIATVSFQLSINYTEIVHLIALCLVLTLSISVTDLVYELNAIWS